MSYLEMTRNKEEVVQHMDQLAAEEIMVPSGYCAQNPHNLCSVSFCKQL